MPPSLTIAPNAIFFRGGGPFSSQGYTSFRKCVTLWNSSRRTRQGATDSRLSSPICHPHLRRWYRGGEDLDANFSSCYLPRASESFRNTALPAFNSRTLPEIRREQTRLWGCFPRRSHEPHDFSVHLTNFLTHYLAALRNPSRIPSWHTATCSLFSCVLP